MKDTPTVTELKHKMLEYVKEPRTKQEIMQHMDCDLAEPLMRDLVGKGAMRIAPQSNGSKWVQTAKAIKMERGEE